ncbi:bi-domain-containing oxidoreductase [Akkermansiaceae bacterium]|nr:bi-domain-containing oxidoreductase [Akkermansiaceae bacterium]
MNQIIQNLNDGKTSLAEVPMPLCNSRSVLIQTSHSLVSLGTEKMLVDFGKGSFLQKAKQQPDKVKEVIAKVKTDGLAPTIAAVKNKLEQPIPLGYCNVGIVIEVGRAVTEFKVGDRVASNGPHAEFVSVPKNLVAKIPEEVSEEQAAFTVIGSIGLQGIRLVNPTLGETVVVVGLGLIGLITAQLLKANGCNVIGFDFDQSKVDLANSFGIDSVNPGKGVKQVEYVLEKTNQVGCDRVIITASNPSNEIISQSAQMSRKRGCIVLVGVIGLDIKRSDFYEKELSFQVSCSYGPGRYDSNYEEGGNDYPLPYVRWTEKRNFEAVLNALSNGTLDVDSLITERVLFENYSEIYDNIGKGNSIASLLVYDTGKPNVDPRNVKVTEPKTYTAGKPVLGVIGAGNFTGSTILPKLKAAGAQFKSIASSKGLSGSIQAKKHSIENSTTDHRGILADSEINTVLVTTQHDSHSMFVSEALENDKHVFVEKPLSTTWEGLERVESALEKSKGWVTVGFNRRFAPLTLELKKRLSPAPMNIMATMNAGFIPPEVWVHDIKAGGGRIIGEACHFIDLCTYFTGSEVVEVCMNAMGPDAQANTDNASILLKYKNGSNAVINYFSNGSKSYPKERIELHQQNSTLVLDNWRKLTGFGVRGFKSKKSRQDKGYFNQFKKLLDSVEKASGPTIPWEEVLNTSKATLAAVDSLIHGKWISIK